MKVLQIFGRVFLGAVVIWLLLIGGNLWMRRERPPHAALKKVHSALLAHLKDHGQVWPRDPKTVLKDLIQQEPDLANAEILVFTEFDDEPNSAFRYRTMQWAILTQISSGISYHLMPDGSLKRQLPVMISGK